VPTAPIPEFRTASFALRFDAGQEGGERMSALSWSNVTGVRTVSPPRASRTHHPMVRPSVCLS
jgi:hypothetical protein